MHATTGVLTGTPTVDGLYEPTIRATGPGGTSNAATSWTIDPLE
jgi:hypothetical protein